MRRVDGVLLDGGERGSVPTGGRDAREEEESTECQDCDPPVVGGGAGVGGGC